MTEWSKKTVGQEITKAYKTLNRVGGPVGPEGYTSLLADYEGCINSNPVDVTRMEAVMDILITDLPSPDERKLLMDFHFMKAKGKKIPEICEKLDYPRRTLYRRIDELHQKLIEPFALNERLRGVQKFDSVAQNPQIPHVKGELRVHGKRGSIQGWMEPNARPKSENLIEVQEQS